MKLTYVKLCLNCNEVFYDGQRCPKCASTQWWFISKWLDRRSKQDVDIHLTNPQTMPEEIITSL